MSGAKVGLMGAAFGGKIFHAVSKRDTRKMAQGIVGMGVQRMSDWSGRPGWKKPLPRADCADMLIPTMTSKIPRARRGSRLRRSQLKTMLRLEAWRVRRYTHRNVGMSTGEDRFAVLSFTLSSLCEAA